MSGHQWTLAFDKWVMLVLLMGATQMSHNDYIKRLARKRMFSLHAVFESERFSLCYKSMSIAWKCYIFSLILFYLWGWWSQTPTILHENPCKYILSDGTFHQLNKKGIKATTDWMFYQLKNDSRCIRCFFQGEFPFSIGVKKNTDNNWTMMSPTIVRYIVQLNREV